MQGFVRDVTKASWLSGEGASERSSPVQTIRNANTPGGLGRAAQMQPKMRGPKSWALIRIPTRRSRKKLAALAPMSKKGEGKEAKRSSIPKDIPAEEFGLEWAVKLLSLPREVGIHPETGEPVTAQIGRYGPYLTHNKKSASLESTMEVFEIGMNAAVAKLADAAKKGPGRGRGKAEPLKILGKHPRTELELKLMDGRYGPYVTDGSINASLPKTVEKDELTLEEAAQLIDARAAKGPAKKRKKKAPKKKKAAAKKKPVAKKKAPPKAKAE